MGEVLYIKDVTETSPIDEGKIIVDFDPTTYSFEAELVKTLPLTSYVARRFANKYHDADDLMQFAAMQAMKHKESFVPGTNMRAWLNFIIRNHANSGYRKYKREVETGDLFFELRGVAASAHHAVELKEALKAISYLTPHKRVAFELIVLEEMSYEEAALELNIPIGSVKSRVSRAYDELYAYFQIERIAFTDSGKIDASA